MIVGLGLLGFEILTPGGLVLVFFGAAGVIVGLLSATVEIAPWAQWGLFSFFSIMGLLFLRKPLLERFSKTDIPKSNNDLIGEAVVLSEPLNPSDETQATVRGTTWRVRNVSAEALPAQLRTVVVGVEGLTLLIDRKPSEREQ